MLRLLGILLVGSMALIFSVYQSWAAIKIRNSSLDNLNKAIVLLLKRDDSAACRIVDQYIETQDISVSNYVPSAIYP